MVAAVQAVADQLRVDADGNIHVHGREGLQLAIGLVDPNTGMRRGDISAVALTFNIEGRTPIPLDPGLTPDERVIRLPFDVVQTLPLGLPLAFVLVDPSAVEPPWTGLITAYGYEGRPA